MIGDASLAKLSAKDFLAEVAGLAQGLRGEIEAHAQGLDPAPAARAARRKRVLGGDFRFFAYTYFPHHIRGESSLFQAQFCGRLPQILAAPSGGAREWWLAPRGECKSSLLSKIGPCYVSVLALLQRPEVRAETGLAAPAIFTDYAIMLGAETRLPAKLLESVKTELTVNAALSLDFPEACGRSPVWKIGEFVTKSGVKFESFGAEQHVRGTFHGASRPKLLLGDDLISDAEAKSPTERDNRWAWLEAAIEYLGPPDGTVNYLAVGTKLARDDPIDRAERTVGHLVHAFRAIEHLPARMDLWERCEELMRNADREAQEGAAQAGNTCPEEALPSYRFFLAHRRDMEQGAVTSWPTVRPLYRLMKARAKSRGAFEREMQGVARSNEDRVFHRLSYWVHRAPHWIEFAAVDPSMGKGENSHPSAILGGAWDTATKKLHVHTAAIKRRVPSKLEADLIAYQRAHTARAIAFENNNAYEAMRLSIIRAGLAATPPVALPLVGVTATVAPEVLIDALEPFLCDGLEPRILLSEGLTQLEDELDTWPERQSRHHYDGLVALHLLWAIASTRAAGMSFASTGERASAGLRRAYGDFFGRT